MKKKEDKLFKSIPPNVRKYYKGFKRWQKWRKDLGLDLNPPHTPSKNY